MLVLEIELLTGAYRAALSNGSAAEWPPHPERVLSALTQAWDDGGQCPRERAALEWLEQQDHPRIEADGPLGERDAPIVYVPPNDQRGDEIAALPERRQRQARTFRAVSPATPLVRLLWPAPVDPGLWGALEDLAHRVASLGHSSSLVRFSVSDGEGNPAYTWTPDDAGSTPLRTLHPGRLGNLVRWYEAKERPRPGRTAWYRAPGDRESGARDEADSRSAFGGPEDWFIFAGTDGPGPKPPEDVPDGPDFVPDLLGFAQVARVARAALMRCGPQSPARVLSGHDDDGAPVQVPHVAFVPLADVGWFYSRGDLLGFAVVLPHKQERREDPDRKAVIAALCAFAGLDGKQDPEQAGRAWLRFARGIWHLERLAAPDRASLHPERYCKFAATWASVTPVVLDRYADANDPVEEAAIIAAACRNIGLPEPVAIEIHKHSALRGAPSAYPARGVLHRPDWSFPAGSKFRQRPRRHVVLRFASAVRGPVLIGAGRYHGFGLCVPLSEEGK